MKVILNNKCNCCLLLGAKQIFCTHNNCENSQNFINNTKVNGWNGSL